MSIYMQATGIQGNVTTSGYQNWIALRHIHLNKSRRIQTAVGRVNDVHETVPNFSHISLVKTMDRSSNGLFEHLCNGKNIDKVEIHVCGAGAGSRPYAKYILTNARVARHEQSVAEDGAPVEMIDLSFTKIEQAYIEQQSNGLSGSPHITGFDLETAKLS